MNPLSPFTYYRRHKHWALALIALLALTVAGLYLFIGLAQATYIDPAFAINRYLSRFNLVQPDQASSLDPDVAPRILANPDVSRVLPQNDIKIKVSNIGGANFPFRLIGLKEGDADTVMAQSGVSLKAGRLPQPGTNEVALSEEIAAALKLEIGDTFDRTRDEKAYPSIVSPLQVVGILTGRVRLGIMSYEYLDQSESYRGVADSGLLVITLPGREAAVEDFLRQFIRTSTTKTYTYQSVSEQVARDQSLLYTLGIPVVLLVSTAIALVIGAINQLSFAQRLAELGTLYAIGHRRDRLLRRLTLETAGPALIGWAVGIMLAWGGMSILSSAVYAPRGFASEAVQITPILFVIFVPLVVIGSTLLTAARSLRRMDAVAVVERGQLTMEGEWSMSAQRVRAGGLPRPLASSTYYQRHARQAVALIGATLALILGTALLFFIFEAGADAMQPALNNLSHISAVSPNNQPLDPTIIDRIRAHPAVERVMNVYPFVPMKISIPPMFPDRAVETLCVSAQDMAYLVELYHLQIADGRLPRPDTNDIVIPWAVAKNRDIHVGDVIGDPANPVYSGAPSLPIEVVVSGIFAPADTLAEETWLSFMSLEFVEKYRESDLSLIIVPRAEEKAAFDAWLESQIAGDNRIILTYGNQQAALQRQMGSMLFTFLLMESVIALVAALALVGLHYLFVTGRQAELSTLHALGFTRSQLVWRIVREMFFTIAAAWCAGMAGCTLVLLFLQHDIFASAGLRLNFFNPVPWLTTLPIPMAVLITGAAITMWRLSRLDPVAIIERR